MQARADQKSYESKEGVAKSVIQIVLPGGMAHQESWDPKPEAPLEYRGPFGVAKTKLPGVVFNENFKQPRRRRRQDDRHPLASPARKPTTAGRSYTMFTGYRKSPAIEHPSLGAVVSHEFGPRKDLPPYVAVPERHRVRRHRLPRLAVRPVRHRQRPGPQRLPGPRPDAAAGRR